MKLTRREALIAGAVVGAGAAIGGPRLLSASGATVGQLDPNGIPQFVTQLFIPPAMPTAATTKQYDRYSLAARSFRQQILPKGFPSTQVFGFGSTTDARTFHAPGYTIEATVDRETRLTWANQLVNASGDYLPHFLPVDPTLHWANPPGGTERRRQADEVRQDPGPLHRAGAAGGAHPRRARLRGLRRLPRGLVLAAGQEHPQGLRHRRQQVLPVQGGGARAGGGRVVVRDGAVRVQQRPARHQPLVPRPQPRPDPAERAGRAARPFHPAGRRRRPAPRGAARA